MNIGARFLLRLFSSGVILFFQDQGFHELK